MLDFSRLVNHYSSAITILLFPLVYVIIMSLGGKEYGIGIYVVSGICIPAGITLFVIKKKELQFYFYECSPRISTDRLKKALEQICENRKWHFSKVANSIETGGHFEIKTPANYLSWGCLLTLVPVENGFRLRCINAVDYPFNQVFFSFGHRKRITTAFLNDIHKYTDGSEIKAA